MSGRLTDCEGKQRNGNQHIELKRKNEVSAFTGKFILPFTLFHVWPDLLTAFTHQVDMKHCSNYLCSDSRTQGYEMNFMVIVVT